jgi:intraflagellar transport protein 81
LQIQVVYPVLEWLLSRIDDLKKRAYLAKFLVKVEIPPEVVSDPDLSEMYEQVRKVFES